MTIMTTFVGAMKNKMIQNSSWSFLLVRFYLVGKIFCVIFSLFHYHICSFLLSLNKILRLGTEKKKYFSFVLRSTIRIFT